MGYEVQHGIVYFTWGWYYESGYTEAYSRNEGGYGYEILDFDCCFHGNDGKNVRLDYA